MSRDTLNQLGDITQVAGQMHHQIISQHLPERFSVISPDRTRWGFELLPVDNDRVPLPSEELGGETFGDDDTLESYVAKYLKSRVSDVTPYIYDPPVFAVVC